MWEGYIYSLRLLARIDAGVTLKGADTAMGKA
jgi:hypothetical protein